MASEHIRKNIPCSEFCFIDPAYCPLCHYKKGNGSEESRLNIKVNRWTGESASEITESGSGGIEQVDINFFEKKTPEDSSGYQKWEQGTGTDIYSEQIEAEHSRFSPYSCWCDGSGFEFDILPDNLVGNVSSMESLYDLSYYPMDYKPMEMSDWNAWIDKFQVDYRWGQVSDQNAETILFPNVDDPWMFTEYIFQGTGSGEIIVEPPLYDEVTLKISNTDKNFIQESQEEDILQKYQDEHNTQSVPGENHRWDVKSYRKVTNWSNEYQVQDSGGKLYKVNIPVESVKWGEHGNIPPGTINMGAPKSWMDPGQNNGKIVPKFIAHIGSPFYACSYGVVYWHNKEAYIDPISLDSPTDDEDGRPYIKYAVKPTGDHGVKQNTPEDVITQSWSSQNDVQAVNIHMSTGDYSHGGCSLLNGSGGCLKCSAIYNAEIGSKEFNTLKQYFGRKCASYNPKNADCPKFVARSQYPILADYEGTAQNLAEYRQKVAGVYSSGSGSYSASDLAWADNMLNGTGQIGDIFGIFSSNSLGRPDVYNDKTQVNIWYEAQFTVEYESDNSVKTTKKGAGDGGFGKGVEVIRGSGKMALDTYENSNGFRGDTVFFGDMDQVSYSRWFETPMFCANSGFCNETCGLNMKSGFTPGERAGDSKNGKCKYYRNHGIIACPINAVQKRALEFQETITRCSSPLLMQAAQWASYNESQREFFNSTSDYYFFEDDKDHDYTEDPKDTKVWNLYYFYPGNTEEQASTDFSDEVSAAFGGIKVKSSKNITRTRGGAETTQKGYLISKIRVTPAASSDAFFWYDAMDNAGNVAATWLCKCVSSYTKFKKNTMIITNEEKFIGGYHPQYKDYSKRGEEYMMDVESDSYRDAMGDIIGDVDNDGQPQAVNKQGYWTDESGDYIVDERAIGVDEEIADDASREGTGSPTTISFKKSNTSINGETGETKKPKTVNCAVHSNDPWTLINFYKTNGSISSFSYYDANDNLVTRYRSKGRPQYEDDEGETYWAPPHCENKLYLPTMRLAAHCPTCDYYISWRYHDLKCPWCGSTLERITGSTGETEFGADDAAIGKTWPENASIIRKFFKINAIGNVQVWAPPGTCVPKDGYYWKNPTVVTNTLIRQLKYRLGDLNESGWSPISTMSIEKDFTMGYPEQMGYHKPSDKFGTEEDDAGTIYEKLKWEGITKENRKKYSSVNEIMPETEIPGLVTDNTNEQFILPYTSTSDDGLKIVLADEIISLRNRLEPVMAYTSDIPSNKDYPRLRASYEQRTSASFNRYSLHTSCRVPSLVLAANDTGNDAYVQFWSGDAEWGSVREYYPPGMSWWWLNGVMGARYSSLDGGYYHMDSPSFLPGGGHRTVAKCAIFINGILPLDKEILKAYLIISPAGEPSKEPIGRGWNGVIHYEHYHANNTDFTWDDSSKIWVCPHKGDGTERHLHGQAGFKGVWDGNGDYHDAAWSPSGVIPMSEGGYFGWGSKSEQPDSYRSIYDDKFDSNWVSLCGFTDETCWSQAGSEKINIGVSGKTIYVYRPYDDYTKTGIQNKGIKYNSRTPSKYANDKKYKYIGVDENNNIIQNYSTDEIWQDLSQSEFESRAESSRVTVEFTATDGEKDHEVSKTFSQFSQQFMNSVYPSQMQQIAGYFNFEGINSEMSLQDKIGMLDKSGKTVPDHPIIVQEGPSKEEDFTEYSGSTVSEEAGIVTRVLNVTPLVKRLYNTRVDRRFWCKAGKTLEEVSEKDFGEDDNGNTIPAWEGTGDGEIKEKEWNLQERWSGKGYLLNDLSTYPKVLEDKSLPEIPDNGDQYELAPKSIKLTLEFSLPIIIDESCNKYWFVHDGEESSSYNEITVPQNGSISFTTAQQALSQIKSLLGENYECKIQSDSMITAERSDCAAGSKLEIREAPEDCYSKFGFSVGAYECFQNRCISVTEYYPGYDPIRLSKGYPWITNAYRYNTHRAIFDLARAPLERAEKNYRYTAPSVDIRSCYCPKEGCGCHESGMTVGMWGERYNHTVSTGSVNCPSCGEDLSEQQGAVIQPGDGLYSYYYLSAFDENPFITGFSIALLYNSSFRISAKYDGGETWRALLNVEYNEESRLFSYSFLGRLFTNIESLPTDFILPQNNWFRARYIQIEVLPAQSSEFRSYSGTQISNVSDYSIGITGNFNDMGELSWDNINCKLEFSDDTADQINTLSYASINADNTLLTLYTKKAITSTNVYRVSLKPKRFYSGIESFRAYGFHYKDGDLTMTGPAKDKTFVFKKRSFSYQMQEYPTQILEVSLGQSQSGGITLTRASSKDELKYTLIPHAVPIEIEEQEESLDPIYTTRIGYSIASGNYYFDNVHNKIILPSFGVYSENIKLSVDQFEDEIKSNKYCITYYPSNMSIRYWTGSGEEITLEATAEKQGPSYQLEKNTITKIETISAFPDNGESEKIPDMSGNNAVRKIPWVCYNKIPSTLKYSTQLLTGGSFSLPDIPSTYLGKTVDNDKYFRDKFGENNSNIIGRCVTEVTFFGAPDKVISGSIAVVAPAITEYTIDAGNGESITVKERTGGIENGCIIVKTVIPERKGRATLAYSKPTLIIYARERKIDDPI